MSLFIVGGEIGSTVMAEASADKVKRTQTKPGSKPSHKFDKNMNYGKNGKYKKFKKKYTKNKKNKVSKKNKVKKNKNKNMTNKRSSTRPVKQGKKTVKKPVVTKNLQSKEADDRAKANVYRADADQIQAQIDAENNPDNPDHRR